MQEIDSCGKVIHTGDVQGSEKGNDTCMKTMQCENKISLYFLDPFLAYRAIKPPPYPGRQLQEKSYDYFRTKDFWVQLF